MKYCKILILLIISINTYAQNGINYKAIIKDDLGSVLSNQSIEIQFDVLQTISQNSAYKETHSLVTDLNGLVLVDIGLGTPVSGNFSTIDWSVDETFLNVKIDTGEGFIDLGTTAITQVPKAYYAEVSETAQNVSGLEKIEEGLFSGWRLIGRDPANYGNIGLDAVDLSNTSGVNSVMGATGPYSFALGLNTRAIGLGAVASGEFSEASGNYSQSINYQTLSQGHYSFAFGKFSRAIGEGSAAGGFSSESNGENSFTVGLQSVTNSDDAFTAGVRLVNDTYGGSVLGLYNSIDPLAILNIGIGDPNNRRSGLKVMGSGEVLAPEFNVNQMINDKSLVTKEYVDTNINGLQELDEGNENGWRLKNVNPNDYGNIGLLAVDLSLVRFDTGTDSYGALGTNSFATGLENEASGYLSSVFGSRVKATGTLTTAIGTFLSSESFNCFSIGRYNTGGGNPLGWVESDPLFEVGNGSSDSNRRNALTILKNGTHIITSENQPDLILGGKANGTTEGDDGIIASDPNLSGSDIVIQSNDAIVFKLDNNDDEFGQFEILAGNGTEIFEVDEQGNVRQNGTLIHSSDKRLKTNILDLEYGLKEILQLQPKAYNWKQNPKTKKSFGLIAQEVDEIMGEIVSQASDKDKMLGVSYIELIPVLINAIKEQHKEINNLKSENNKKDLNFSALLKRVESLEADRTPTN